MNLIKKYENPKVLTRHEVNQMIRELELDSEGCISIARGNTIVKKDDGFIEVITILKTELWK